MMRALAKLRSFVNVAVIVTTRDGCLNFIYGFFCALNVGGIICM